MTQPFTGDETIPTPRSPRPGQPTRRTTPPPTSPYPPPRPAVPPPAYACYPPRPAASSARRRRGSCLIPPLIAFTLILCAIVGMALVGYALWQWSATLPRTNVLILGLDRRPDESLVTRSDTMILMTVYPPGPHVALLSIPRDLYVDIPGYGQSRINTAHFWGENEAAGNGPLLAMQTAAQDFGVPVDRYVRVDFAGFRAVVDAVGGVDVVVEEAVVDSAYPTDDYGTIAIEIPAGPQHMDGETALRYARSRHGSSDFERAERQQQILAALARRLLQPETWLRLPALYLAIAEHVDTNLALGETILMAPTFYRVGADGIERHAITGEMTDSWTTPTGGAVLLPRWEAINPLVQELFTP